MTYQMSWERTDRWAELEAEYDSMLEELKDAEEEDVFLPVAEFDELEIL